MTTAGLTSIMIRLAKFHAFELGSINESLERGGYPKFYLGGFEFNTEYRLLPTTGRGRRPPKFEIVWRGWRPGLELTELYLWHLPTLNNLDQEPRTEAPDANYIIARV